MRRVPITLAAALAACSLLGVASCSQVKSSDPLSPSIAGPIAGVNISYPAPMAPASGSQIAVDQQPVNLVVQNASTNGVRPLSYRFEVATDAGFTAVVATQTGVPPGANGQTSLRLTQVLPADRTYYWHARAEDGANTGVFAAPVNFKVYTPVVIQAPTPRLPADGTTVATAQPTLVADDATRTGPAGAISYVFEVATDGAMANRVVAVQVGEASGQTSYALASPLAAATHFYWHVRAQDPSHQSAWSSTLSFVTPQAPVIPTPTPTPSPTPGGPAAGDQLNLSKATILNSPPDLASWAVTTSITALDISSGGIHVDFSKKDGPGRWPDIIPPGFTGPIEYTLGMVLTINGQLYASAPIQMWNGLDRGGGPPSQYALNWFYDPARWAPMTFHQPAVGELIGFFVAEGSLRNDTAGTSSPLKERSNVVVVPMPSDGGASFTFSVARLKKSGGK
jgi:hypothetical protein